VSHPPGGGSRAHFHNHCEEMFVIFDGESQFHNRCALPCSGPCRSATTIRHSHSIYIRRIKSVQWMNINIGMAHDFYDAFNLDDSRVGRAARYRSNTCLIARHLIESASDDSRAYERRYKARFNSDVHSIPPFSSRHVVCHPATSSSAQLGLPDYPARYE